MTSLLETAYSKLIALSEADQDAIAALILEELEDEGRWGVAFARSQDVLAQLAQEALAERKAGKTLPLDPNAL
jgi:hypothetical protein